MKINSYIIKQLLAVWSGESQSQVSTSVPRESYKINIEIVLIGSTAKGFSRELFEHWADP